ncbi:MAG: hypothetical protein K2X32_07510 [Phycisphaerales bacterium]|nr:hypothetical protein [Phycisphaerales bacterium]
MNRRHDSKVNAIHRNGSGPAPSQVSAGSTHTSAPPELPPGTPSWITLDLVHLTIRVWQKYYAQPLSAEDSVTIILNAGQLFRALAKSDHHEALRCTGTRLVT